MQPVMTKILTSDADNSFTPAINSEIWKGIGSALGFSVAVLAASSVIATGASAAATGTAVGAATGAAILGSSVSTIYAATAGTSSLFSIVFAIGTGATVIAATTAIMMSPTPEENAPPLPSVSEYPSAPTVIVEEPPPAPEPSVQTAGILLRRHTLHYRAGETVPDEAQIVQDAGAQGFDADGNPVDLVVLDYDQVDFGKPSDYYVYLTLPDGDNIRKAVIIAVE